MYGIMNNCMNTKWLEYNNNNLVVIKMHVIYTSEKGYNA